MTHPHTPGAAPGPASYLLVWDAPNLDMGLGAILGGRPSKDHRPRFDAVGRWLIGQATELAAETGERIEPEATVFTNVSASSADMNSRGITVDGILPTYTIQKDGVSVTLVTPAQAIPSLSVPLRIMMLSSVMS